MNRLVALAFILGLSGSAVQAMPLTPNLTSDSMIIKVADGCGRGFHRIPNGACVPNRGDVIVVPGAVIVEPGRGPCGGAGRHRVCYPDGRCVMVCN